MTIKPIQLSGAAARRILDAIPHLPRPPMQDKLGDTGYAARATDGQLTLLWTVDEHSALGFPIPRSGGTTR